MHFDQATNGNFRYQEFVKFFELDKFVSGTSITKKIMFSFFLEQISSSVHVQVHTCSTQIKSVLK